MELEPPAALRLLAVDNVARALLLLLDAHAVDALAESFQASNSLRTHTRDAPLWAELERVHFGAARPEALRSLSLPARARGWPWTDPARSCGPLRDFLRSLDEREAFERRVRVVRGDLRKVREVDGAPIDAIAFPTNSHLTNHFTGAAGAVFERAGRELVNFVNDPLFRGRRPTGSAVATPGFNAGVRKLIHCVGPSISMDNCYQLLEITYRNAMSAVMHEDLHCVALTSISTGNLGVPVKGGAQVGLRAIQKFMRSNDWSGTIAIVCVDMHVHDAFTKAKQEILDNFNIEPPHPTHIRWVRGLDGGFRPNNQE